MELYFIKHILSSLLDFDTVHTVKPCLKGKAYAPQTTKQAGLMSSIDTSYFGIVN
jgi:hypothetical protein